MDARPGAGAIVVDGDGRFLALRRAQDPGRGLWGVPGGFCDGEHPEAAAVREVSEETGLSVRLGGLVGIYTDAYVSQGESFPTLHVYYLATVVAGSVLRPSSGEVVEARWSSFAEPPRPWAFPHLAGLVRDAAEMTGKGAGVKHDWKLGYT